MTFRVVEYLKYLYKSFVGSLSKDDFIHSFQKNILNKKLDEALQKKIDNLRLYYQKENFEIPKEDYGAGSKAIKDDKILHTNQLYRKVSISAKYGKILSNIVTKYNVKNSLELGTSLGISTAYMSQSNIDSIEGNKALAELAHSSLTKLNFNSQTIFPNKFEECFEKLLEENKYDLIFVDGNHTKKATLAYFQLILKHQQNQTIVVFDDINWSIGMKNAWDNIKTYKEAKICIDLFKFGLVFLNDKKTHKKEYTLWY